jgi:hypothetical protein
MKLISKAIASLYPTVEFVIEDEDYNKIRWIKNQPDPLPALSVLETEAARLAELEERMKYQSLRAVEYPPVTDYLDAVVKGDLAQQQAYIDACLAVKAKYPKGTQ